MSESQDSSNVKAIKMIRANLIEPTQAGHLEYFHDPETEQHLLFLRSPLNAKVKSNLNVSGGLVIFGTDERRVINSLEINIPRKRWHIKNDIVVPRSVGIKNIELKDLTSRHDEIELPVTVYSDTNYFYVYVKFGQAEENPIWVKLSENCLASTRDDYLLGFFINRIAGGRLPNKFE